MQTKYIPWSDRAAAVFTGIYNEHRQSPSMASEAAKQRAEQLAAHEEASQVYEDHVFQAIREQLNHGRLES